MADPSSYPDATDDTSVGPSRESTTGTPRWVYVFGIIALIVVLLFVAVMLVGGGSHGPSRHTSSADPGRHPPRSSIMNQGVHQR